MCVSWKRDDDVAVVTIENPPVNAASHAVRTGLVAALSEANDDPAIRAIVLACAGRTFVAGADVKEFGAVPKAPYLTEVTGAIEGSAKPVVAAIHGTALGGGFEMVLAAHARIATADAEFGLPEVKLGIIPGAGGTQRLPRLVGMEKAIEWIASGRRIAASEAQAAGILDRICEGEIVTQAKQWARSLIDRPLRRTGRLSVPQFDTKVVSEQIAAIEKKARGQVAPVSAARMVRRAAAVSLETGLAEERACFLELVSSSQAAALRYVFAAERNVGKVPDLEGSSVRELKTIGIVGAGLMGAGIAVSFLDAGFPVNVVEGNAAAAAAGRQRIEALYTRARKSGHVSDAIASERLSHLHVATDLNTLAACDLVLEAVFDDLQVKQNLLASLVRIVGPDAILATNTSYLDPDAIATVVDYPQRFLGMHFFSPANVMWLVEVVRTSAVSRDVLATTLAVVKRIGKLGVVSGVCEGFIGNRIFSAYRQECDLMLEEGALPHEIDVAMESFGFPMGPYAVNDLAGLDISWARRKRNAASRDLRERYVVIANRLCEAGRLGQKTGKGYYAYENGRRSVDQEVTAIIEAASRDAGVQRRVFETDEILSRVFEAMVAAGRKILNEGIALRASDIDLVLINGYGYRAWRGGPMYQAGMQ